MWRLKKVVKNYSNPISNLEMINRNFLMAIQVKADGADLVPRRLLLEHSRILFRFLKLRCLAV